MLSEQLERAWRERLRSSPIDVTPRLAEEGLLLGAGTVMASSVDETAGEDARLSVLVTVARLKAPSAAMLAHLRKATRRWREGDEALARMHLALSGLGQLRRPQGDARRLFFAEALLEAGMTAEDLLKVVVSGTAAADLVKYNPDQPRVPAGNGRPSGQWTTSGATPARPTDRQPSRTRGGGRAPQPSPRTPTLSRPTPSSKPARTGPPARNTKPPPAPTVASLAGAAAAGGRIGAGLDLGALSGRTLTAVAAFVAGLAPATAVGAGVAVAGGFGLALIPSAGPTGRWVRVPGPGNISYFQSPDVPGLVFRYTTADGKEEEIKIGPGPGGEYRDPRTGKVFARWVKTGGKIGLLISTGVLLKDENGSLCPQPEEEHHGTGGREYEDFVKKVFNHPPTPSGFGYGFTDPRTGKNVVFDDCQRPTGALAEYKGETYEEFLQDRHKRFIWDNVLSEMIDQATRQEAARDGRPIVWFFNSRAVRDAVQSAFEGRFPDIQFVWLPMPRKRK